MHVFPEIKAIGSEMRVTIPDVEICPKHRVFPVKPWHVYEVQLETGSRTLRLSSGTFVMI